MAIPDGYEKLAVIGIAYRGNYDEGTAYGKLNAVYYGGSTFVALKDSPAGPPAADGANWQYLAQGFMEGVMEAVTVTDTKGILGEAGSTVNAQSFMDAVADRVADKLLAKSQLVNNLLATEPGNPMDAAVGPVIAQMISEINSNLIKLRTLNCKSVQGNVDLGSFFNNRTVLFVSCTTNGYYAEKTFRNLYGMWYICLYQQAGYTVTADPVDVTLVVGYI